MCFSCNSICVCTFLTADNMGMQRSNINPSVLYVHHMPSHPFLCVFCSQLMGMQRSASFKRSMNKGVGNYVRPLSTLPPFVPRLLKHDISTNEAKYDAFDKVGWLCVCMCVCFYVSAGVYVTVSIVLKAVYAFGHPCVHCAVERHTYSHKARSQTQIRVRDLTAASRTLNATITHINTHAHSQTHTQTNTHRSECVT